MLQINSRWNFRLSSDPYLSNMSSLLFSSILLDHFNLHVSLHASLIFLARISVLRIDDDDVISFSTISKQFCFRLFPLNRICFSFLPFLMTLSAWVLSNVVPSVSVIIFSFSSYTLMTQTHFQNQKIMTYNNLDLNLNRPPFYLLTLLVVHYLI